MTKRILLTGATGFLGSHLLGRLIAGNCEVTVLKRSSSDTSRIQPYLSSVNVFDIDSASLEDVFAAGSFDFIVHTACDYGKDGDLGRLIRTNVLFGVRLAELGIRHGVKCFINTDTFFNSAKYNQSYLWEYTLSKKQMVEWLARLSDKIQVINLKLHHVYGPNDNPSKFVSWVLSRFDSSAPAVELTECSQRRDFVYVADVVNAFETAINNAGSLPQKFTEMEVGTGHSYPVKTFLQTLAAVYDRNKNANASASLVFGALPMRPGEIIEVSTDNLALRSLGWEPVFDIESGCEQLLKSHFTN